MELSSPLAAMRPQPCPAWGNRKDLPLPRTMHNGYQTYGPHSFDFKHLSMQQQQQQQHPQRQQRSRQHDYFTAKPVRGSSPTSSLTADLGANFHIDLSPQAPTPRRSLFTADLFRPHQDDTGRLMTPPTEAEEVTTPDVPSSSPGIDAMDVSPLPHKAPYLVTQVTLPSPTPEFTPELEDGITSGTITPSELLAVPTQPPTFLQLPERKRPLTRPSLTRTKAQSTSYIPQKASAGVETSLPAFRFGNVLSNGLSCSSTPSLLEGLSESPVDDPRPTMPLPPSRRPSIGAMSRNSGSPSSGHVRKPSAGRPPFGRPQRKMMRRSLSMFQHPDDVMKEEQDTFEPQPCLASVMDVDQTPHAPKLPCFIPDEEPDSLPRISQDTMADILNSKYDAQYTRIMVVDCRFEYEYDGGHIENAVNFNDKQQLTHDLFHSASDSTSSSLSASSASSTLLILHCEYSVHRAPLTAKHIRNHDRSVNAAHYPRLSYPELYILDGGYSKFFASHRAKCVPQSYVEMNDERHELACERGMAKVKQRQKLFRHQTFAFGQVHAGSDDMDDSPTAMGRGGAVGLMGAHSHSTFDLGRDVGEGLRMSFARRMASY